MKAKSLVLIGVLIIALAAMAAPVMAGSGSGSSDAQGTQGANVSFSVVNGSITFGSFTVGPNSILPTGTAAFPVVSMYSNEATWSVTVRGNNAKMTTTSPVYTLNSPLKIQAYSITPVPGYTQVSSNQMPSLTDLTTTATTFVQGSGALNMENTTVGLQQTVSPLDIGAGSGNPYKMTITFDYAGSV
jgi:hypothetical protein